MTTVTTTTIITTTTPVATLRNTLVIGVVAVVRFLFLVGRGFRLGL